MRALGPEGTSDAPCASGSRAARGRPGWRGPSRCSARTPRRPAVARLAGLDPPDRRGSARGARRAGVLVPRRPPRWASPIRSCCAAIHADLPAASGAGPCRAARRSCSRRRRRRRWAAQLPLRGAGRRSVGGGAAAGRRGRGRAALGDPHAAAAFLRPRARGAGRGAARHGADGQAPRARRGVAGHPRRAPRALSRRDALRRDGAGRPGERAPRSGSRAA